MLFENWFVLFLTAFITVAFTFSLKVIGSYHSKKKWGGEIIASFKLSV